MASVSDLVFVATLAPKPLVLPKATLNSSVVGVEEFEIPKKYSSLVSYNDDETTLVERSEVEPSEK